MSYSDYSDFYQLFEQHPQEFSKAQTYDEFCTLVDKEYLSRYAWASRVFNTAKAGKCTYRPLAFPQVNTLAELFEDAKFLPSPTGGLTREQYRAKLPQGYLCCSDYSFPLPSNVGGKRSWSKDWLARGKKVRAHYGATFYSVYVKPTEIVRNVRMTLAPTPQSFELIKREDGILVLAHDGEHIGSEWLALLPLSENIETLFDAATKELIANERQAEKLAWQE